jgi:hypothetical protein
VIASALKGCCMPTDPTPNPVEQRRRLIREFIDNAEIPPGERAHFGYQAYGKEMKVGAEDIVGPSRVFSRAARLVDISDKMVVRMATFLPLPNVIAMVTPLREKLKALRDDLGKAGQQLLGSGAHEHARDYGKWMRGMATRMEEAAGEMDAYLQAVPPEGRDGGLEALEKRLRMDQPDLDKMRQLSRRDENEAREAMGAPPLPPLKPTSEEDLAALPPEEQSKIHEVHDFIVEGMVQARMNDARRAPEMMGVMARAMRHFADEYEQKVLPQLQGPGMAPGGPGG